MTAELHRKTYAEVHIPNLKFNIDSLRSVVASDFFCPMVKSNAYGHGDYEVVKALIEKGVTIVGVALVEEALRLRGYGFSDLNILVFGSFKAPAVAAMVQHNITPVISQWCELEKFTKNNTHQYPVHIKFNTGMNRFGFMLSEALALSQYFKKQSALKLCGVATHFANGEDFGQPKGFSQKQMEKFLSLKKLFPEVTFHSMNSPALFASLDKAASQENMGVRPGLSVYGSYPSVSDAQTDLSAQVPLKPVMTLKSEVVAFHSLKAGDRVSYGGTWKADGPSVIGTIPIGYTDGYSRQFSNCGVVLYRGQLVPVVGKVCMDYIMVNLTSALGDKEGALGEEVILFGQGLSVENLSGRADQIPYELMTTMGRRVPRKYIHNECPRDKEEST